MIILNLHFLFRCDEKFLEESLCKRAIVTCDEAITKWIDLCQTDFMFFNDLDLKCCWINFRFIMCDVLMFGFVFRFVRFELMFWICI